MPTPPKGTCIPDGPSLHSSARLRERLDSAVGENKGKVRVGDVILGCTGVYVRNVGMIAGDSASKVARDRRACKVRAGVRGRRKAKGSMLCGMT